MVTNRGWLVHSSHYLDPFSRVFDCLFLASNDEQTFSLLAFVKLLLLKALFFSRCEVHAVCTMWGLTQLLRNSMCVREFVRFSCLYPTAVRITLIPAL